MTPDAQQREPFYRCCRGEGKADCEFMIWDGIDSPTYCTRGNARPHPRAPELTKMLLRSCFGDFGDCPCDDECVVSEYCAKYHEDHQKNSCGMTDSQCGFVQEYEKAEAARTATLTAVDKIENLSTFEFAQMKGVIFVIKKDTIESLRRTAQEQQR
jgi:hypothetical protein